MLGKINRGPTVFGHAMGRADESAVAVMSDARYGLEINEFKSMGSALRYRHGIKRALDIALTLMAAPVLVPVVAVLVLLVLTDGHNPFYRQARVGRNGRVFGLWKLRSMVPDADARLASHLAANPAAKEEWDRTQKLKSDPRITPVGRILRASSLDELPQFWNVLRGDMSLVGPRPMMPSQVRLYPGRAYFDLRPGITGLWQVSARNESTFADRARFDDDYHQRLTLFTDVKILFATVGVVLRGTGY